METNDKRDRDRARKGSSRYREGSGIELDTEGRFKQRKVIGNLMKWFKSTAFQRLPAACSAE